MADMSSVLTALARIAAEADGHGPCIFQVAPGGLLVCPHGIAYEVGKPVLPPTAEIGGAA